jgi:hypothetical protein
MATPPTEGEGDESIGIFPNFEKLTSFAETFTPFNQIKIFEEQASTFNQEFYIYSDQAQSNSPEF